MIESTLACLGSELAKKSGLSENKIVYHDKDSIFSYLHDNNLPIELPIISYYCTDIENTTTVKKADRIKGNYNTNFTMADVSTAIPIDLSITIALISSSMTEYFNFISFYFSLGLQPFITVQFNSEEIQGDYITPITEMSPLSTSARGLESKDYDGKGKYYALDGSFKLSTYMIYTTQEKVIRKINFTNSLKLVTL